MLCGEKENDARPSRAKERDDEKCKQNKNFCKAATIKVYIIWMR